MNSPSDQLNKRIDLKLLTRAQARVEIAKDVIAALKAKIIRTGDHFSRTFVAIKNPTAAKRAGEKADVFEYIEVPIRSALKDMQSCQVCARGAMFIACIARDPFTKAKAEFNSFDKEFAWKYDGSGHPPDVVALKKYFTSAELFDLEDEFERGTNEPNESEASRTSRLIEMMNRIVNSRGASIH